MYILTKEFLMLCSLILISMHNVDGIHVTITNTLEDNSNLIVHCKSGDDDLGSHLLHYGQRYGFIFKNNFWGTTLFFCTFRWKGVLHWFDIYKEGRDYGVCTSCNWFIEKAGPCLARFETDYYYDCNFTWEK